MRGQFISQRYLIHYYAIALMVFLGQPLLAATKAMTAPLVARMRGLVQDLTSFPVQHPSWTDFVYALQNSVKICDIP